VSSTPTQKAQIFGIGAPKSGTPKGKRRWLVKWRVDGRDRTRSFKTRAEADRYRSQLQVAVVDGRRFDLGTGLPESWIERTTTWWSWSEEWLSLKWPQWSGHSRRSAVESLMALTPHLVRSTAPQMPPEVRDWLRHEGYRPGASSPGDVPRWLEQWSVPLTEITPALLETTLTAATTKADGGVVSAEVARRRRTNLGAVLRAAVRRGLLDQNPMERIEWKPPARTLAVDVSTVPSHAEVLEIVDHVTALTTPGARYGALFATIGIAGMRPSEGIGLSVADLTLPGSGWGLAVLRGAATSPGSRYTNSGDVVEDKELKQRPVDAVREVPLSPDLVARLVTHLDRFPPVDGRVFTNGAGRSVTTTNYGPIWNRARAKVWPAPHPLADTKVYDLRHAAATMMLRANVPPAEVAQRLGHSVDVLMRVYAGVFSDERDRSNRLIDEALNAD
jgi:integrase